MYFFSTFSKSPGYVALDEITCLFSGSFELIELKQISKMKKVEFAKNVKLDNNGNYSISLWKLVSINLSASSKTNNRTLFTFSKSFSMSCLILPGAPTAIWQCCNFFLSSFIGIPPMKVSTFKSEIVNSKLIQLFFLYIFVFEIQQFVF